MPKGPQGQKRPADVIGAAVRVARIATGEEPEDPVEAKTEHYPRGGPSGDGEIQTASWGNAGLNA
jgi:hypothetical protein